MVSRDGRLLATLDPREIAPVGLTSAQCFLGTLHHRQERRMRSAQVSLAVALKGQHRQGCRGRFVFSLAAKFIGGRFAAGVFGQSGEAPGTIRVLTAGQPFQPRQHGSLRLVRTTVGSQEGLLHPALSAAEQLAHLRRADIGDQAVKVGNDRLGGQQRLRLLDDLKLVRYLRHDGVRHQ